MKYDWRKHKNYAHLVLGLIILGFWAFMFEVVWAGKTAVWDAVLISTGVTSFATEKIQAMLKLGNNTWQGALKTWSPSLVFVVYKIIIGML